jgi:hypothetical protein
MIQDREQRSLGYEVLILQKYEERQLGSISVSVFI